MLGYAGTVSTACQEIQEIILKCHLFQKMMPEKLPSFDRDEDLHG